MINQSSLETIEANKRGGFQVLRVGGVPLVMPYGAVLSPEQLAALEGAARVADLGRSKVASTIAANVERELGVTKALRLKAMAVAGQQLRKVATAIVAQVEQELGVSSALRVKGVASVGQRLRLVEERRQGQSRRQAVAANQSVAEPEPTDFIQEQLQAVQLARADLIKARLRTQLLRLELERRGGLATLELRADANRARTEMWSALALMREHSHQASTARREQLDAFWAERATAETAQLAEARGEEIGRAIEPEAARALRISSRDGLANLFESRAITAHQYGAGRAYRVAYELARAGLKIANLNASGGGGSRQVGFGPRSAHELQKAYLMARLRKIEERVGALGDRELKLLQFVAGEGHTIRSLGGGGNSREAHVKALRRGLELVVEVLKTPVKGR